MRIIAGTNKGRTLKTPKWDGLRPTSDKLRETLFNILAPRIDGARVLDGCAGTGAVGIEALSRGAADVLFVDADRRAVALTSANLAACGIREGFAVRQGDIRTVLAGMPDARFSLIFLDPPYDAPGVDATLTSAAARLEPDGLIVLERATRRPPAVPASLVVAREVVSGDSTLTFIRQA